MLQKGGLTKGFSFFNGYRETSGQKWTAFTEVLNAVAKNEEEAVQALNSTNENFARFGDVFTVEVA